MIPNPKVNTAPNTTMLQIIMDAINITIPFIHFPLYACPSPGIKKLKTAARAEFFGPFFPPECDTVPEECPCAFAAALPSNGKPHFGHAFALLDIRAPHSEQYFIVAITKLKSKKLKNKFYYVFEYLCPLKLFKAAFAKENYPLLFLFFPGKIIMHAFASAISAAREFSAIKIKSFIK